MTDGHLTGRNIFCIGMAQLINWGITFYMPGVFGTAIMAETGWSPVVTFSGLTVAMLVMGLVSPLTGYVMARTGGRLMMMAGTVAITVACFLMSFTQSTAAWVAVWLLMGVGMRLALYDAAFALLVETAGAGARRAVTLVTLLGGLASALFWPAGAALLQITDWRHALLVYGCAGLLSLIFLTTLPAGRRCTPPTMGRSVLPSAGTAEDRKGLVSGLWYAALIALLSFVSTGVSTHLPQILAAYSMPALTGMLWGVGQVSARLSDVASGARLSALQLNLIVGILLPLCFLTGLMGYVTPAATALFVLGYGAVNGLYTVVKALLPLVLFAPQQYASRTGILLSPGFFLAALAPSAYAMLLERYGVCGTLLVSAILSLFIMMISIVLWRCHSGSVVKRRNEKAPPLSRRNV
ncbi:MULTISPECIES: MFS transporter [unclassified Pantoea]|jgi:MFS family permease|uniref:MFS transporter n=1 Tax=unclassified Pantoea TaxID=2630326 RepID=UPI0023DCD181|nr:MULTISPECIES: MFS transporter [unclassified Pantoea]MDF2043195.1 MFS transporter [Pantoea sp. Cr_R14]MDF2069776.1 MFS transporter [Pantoea sp. Cr_R13]MDF2079199.1 MFS transporter [Pantoea sp. Cr_R21]